MKEPHKYQSHYGFQIETDDEEFPEMIDIIQEENVKDRNAIRIDLYKERWRTPKDTVQLLEKLAELIKENFIK